MTRRKLSITIAIGFIALFGIIAVQVHWIRSAYVQNKISFEQNLNKALNQIVHDLSRQETVFFSDDLENEFHYINKKSGVIYLDSALRSKSKWTYKLEREDIKGLEEDEIIHVETNNKPPKKIKRIHSEMNANGKIIIRTLDNDVEIIQEFRLDSLKNQKKKEIELKTTAHALFKKDSILRKYEARIDSVKDVLDNSAHSIASEKEELNKSMTELILNIQSVTRPFAERIPLEKLETSIKNAIARYNLPKKYAFAITTTPDNRIAFKTTNFEVSELSEAHSIQLFPHSFVSSPEYLFISFPESNPLFRKMLWPITLAFTFTLLLLASLLLIINNLLHHKKLSAIKTDFINNMTHEFKTPIATIQLATDSVMTEQIMNDPEKISYFMRLIKGENKRMNALVERILQMAQLEKKSFSLVKTKVNIHQLIEAVVENSKLKIEQNESEIKLRLEANNPLVAIDEMHITNVLFNLIDNAIKYRSGQLIVEISTCIRNKHFVIGIKDNGQGMNKDTVDHIFDKFFRLTDGDIHTVKGYGLGLSYVKAIIDMHKGQIQVQSEKGIGSQFEISLPI